MNNKAHIPHEDDDSTAIDPNTTFDIIVNHDGSFIEVADTVDAMDGAEVEVIGIVNESDGTRIELTLIEEPSDTPGLDTVDRFVRIEGVGPRVAELLAQAGIRSFSQLSETTAERIIEILSASGKHYRIHDATRWQQEARRLARQSATDDAPAKGLQ